MSLGQILDRSAVAAKYCWNLEALYPTAAAWEDEFTQFSTKIAGLVQFRGTLGNSATQLAEALNYALELKRMGDKLHSYAHMQSDVDTSETKNLGSLQRISNILAEMTAQASFIRPEILGIPPERLEKFLSHPMMHPLCRFVREMVRYRTHTLTPNEERLIALAGETFETPEKVFSQLSNADLRFAEVVEDGKTYPLSHSTFSILLRNENRRIREKTYAQYYEVYEQHKYTMAATLTAALQKDAFLAKARNFDSALASVLFSDNVASETYANLISTITNNLEPLHKYYTLRKRVLHLKDLHISDTYVPLIPQHSISHTYEQAAELVVRALAPLGENYQQILRRGLLAERWVDVFENKGKRSGAYSAGCYDSFPYILLNYKDNDLRQVFTLAHEAGHSMHSYYSRKQPYQDAFYTIFVAEVASIFNEQLLARHLSELYADDKRTQAYLVNQQLDDIKATLYRQVMFAEFELIIHDRIRNNESLTIEEYRQIYGGLLKKYFGPAVTILPADELEFMRIPHFYYSFYVYKYATGLSAAIALAKRVTEGGTAELDAYLNFLSAGCSKFPLGLLKDAGVDMISPQPIQTACELFGSLVERLETLL